MSIEEKRRQVRNIFRGRLGIWYGKRTERCMLLRDISEAARKETKRGFGIAEDEEILLVRDTSSWETRDQGLVITDEAIYCILEDSTPDDCICLPWHSISEVCYIKHCLYFCYEENGEREKIPFPLDFFFPPDANNLDGSGCADLFTRMAKSVSERKNSSKEERDKATGVYEKNPYKAADLYEEDRYEATGLYEKVTFAPMFQLKGNAPAEHASGNNSAPALHRSGSEEEYAQELREMLAEGEISPRERRLLDRLREKLGISVERAQEIEQSLAQPALTAEEQEYLEEYRDCIVEGGDLSDRERRLLDKIRISLNISKERAGEIERLA